MKLMIVGASGLVGWNLQRAAQNGGHQTTGTFSSHSILGLEELRVECAEAVVDMLERVRPDAVVCCSAWSWVDGCEREPARAFLENAERPALLARLSHKYHARFLYFSSSYVFDGEASPYDELALTSPISVYGKSKLLGEQRALEETAGRALIVRTMGVYGEEPQQKNFVYQVVRNLRAGKPMRIPCDQRGNTTSAGDLAAMSLCLLESEASGVWNVAGPQPNLSRKEFALRIAAEYGLDIGLFRFVTTAELGQPAPRPLGGGLIIDRAVEATGIRPNAWRPFVIP